MAAETVKRTFTVDTSDTCFPRCLFFNRFAIEKIEGGHVCAYFGLHINGSITDECACIFTKETILNHRERNLPYLAKIEGEASESPKWSPSRIKGVVDVVDIYNCAHANNASEISMWRILMHTVAVPPKNVKNVVMKGEPVLLLRSDLPIHREFVKALQLSVEEDNESGN